MRLRLGLSFLSLGVLLYAPLALAQDDDAGTGDPEVQAEEAASTSASVVRAAIATAIEEHEPAGSAVEFPADVDRLYCFTQIAGADGETIVHAWIHEGTTRARVELEIGSPLWRTFSSKQILPSWTGNWQVKILTEAGAVLKTIDFSVGEQP
jgi:hypothetical protein